MVLIPTGFCTVTIAIAERITVNIAVIVTVICRRFDVAAIELIVTTKMRIITVKR